MIILGADPGFANFGIVAIEFRGELEIVRLATVVRTKPSATKNKTRVADDNVRRLRTIGSAFDEAIELFAPAVVCSEAQSFGMKNAASAIKLGMAWGTFLHAVQDIPLEQVSPQQMKKELAGRADAGKEEVEAAVRNRWPEIDAELDRAGIPISDRDHAYDAAGAILASMDSELVRLALRLRR